MATVFALLGDEVTLYTLQDILESFGHSVVGRWEASPVDGLDKDTHDLYLVDLNVETGDPCALIVRLRQNHPTARIVAITTAPKEALTLAALEAGAQAVMQKPYEVGKILRLLEAAP